MNDSTRLHKALQLLDLKLKTRSRVESIVVIGSMAAYFRNSQISSETDVDVFQSSSMELILSLSREISSELKIEEDWINNRSSSVGPMPDGFFERLSLVNGFTNLKIYIPSREDMISLKLYAYYIRGALKDMEGVLQYDPLVEDVERSIDFIKNQILFHHGVTTLKSQSLEIEKFKEDFLRLIIK